MSWRFKISYGVCIHVWNIMKIYSVSCSSSRFHLVGWGRSFVTQPYRWLLICFPLFRVVGFFLYHVSSSSAFLGYFTIGNFKARYTPCDFLLLLDTETTKDGKSFGVSAPKTIAALRSLIWPMRQLLDRFENRIGPTFVARRERGSKTSVASTYRTQTNHSSEFSWRIADTNCWPIFSENGEGRRWGLVEWRKWKCINRHVAGEACCMMWRVMALLWLDS